MTRQKTEHHTSTRSHRLKGSTRLFALRRRRTNPHRTRGRLHASSRQPWGSATNCHPPRSTGHHRRHLGSPRLTECHPQSSRDRGAHAAPLDLAYAAARAQRALDDANQTIARRPRFDEHIEQAKTAARETPLVTKRAQQALAQSVASAAAGATAALSLSSHPHDVASQQPRPRNDAFSKGIVACMASAPRVDFSSALATAVVETACTLLSPERPASWQADVLSVEVAWTCVDCTPYARQTRAAPTLALVKALLIAHDEDPDLVFWPNPGGRVGRTKPGETATQRQSRPRGPQPWEWRQKWWGWRPPPPPRG